MTSDAAARAAIGAAARELRLPTVRDQAARLAEIAAREHSTYLAYLAEVLAAELLFHHHRAGRTRLSRPDQPRSHVSCARHSTVTRQDKPAAIG